MWEYGNSSLSSHFSCKSKMVLKNNKREVQGYIHTEQEIIEILLIVTRTLQRVQSRLVDEFFFCRGIREALKKSSADSLSSKIR